MIRRLGNYMPFVVFLTGLCIDSGTRPLAAPFSRIGPLSGLVTQERIPKATESCSPEEAKWWGDVKDTVWTTRQWRQYDRWYFYRL